MINRVIENKIQAELFQNKAIILLGARQVGKSTLLKKLFQNQQDILWLDAENPDVAMIFDNSNVKRLALFFEKNKIVVIDKAQKIDSIGSKLKLIVDHLPEIQVIATGSSAFELRNSLNEPLTGRKFEHNLFPVSFTEMVQHHGLLEEVRMLPERLVFGYYPEIVIAEKDKERKLRLLADSYLYKDILLFKGIRKPEKMLELLKALAWQIGSEVNYSELGKLIGLKNDTVEDYIHLLEQSFVVYRLGAYHTNQRTEIKKGKKIYFVDLGIRNALVNNFAPIETRQDKGALFENFIVNEIIKKIEYQETYQKAYFWRTIEQQEVDIILEKNGHLQCLEIKYNPKSKAKLTSGFTNKYSNYSFEVIHKDNFFEHIM